MAARTHDAFVDTSVPSAVVTRARCTTLDVLISTLPTAATALWVCSIRRRTLRERTATVNEPSDATVGRELAPCVT
eukprot:1633592-Alexandrium_andersonii.AAC.1